MRQLKKTLAGFPLEKVHHMKKIMPKNCQEHIEIDFLGKDAEILTSGDENSEDYWRKKIKKLLK